MKKIALIAAFALGAAPLAGCAELQNAEAFLTSPQTQASIAVLKSGATALICAVANASALASVIETQYADQSIIGTDKKVYVTSADVCAALGGTVAGAGVIP
jgi:hypothetical protein